MYDRCPMPLPSSRTLLHCPLRLGVHNGIIGGGAWNRLPRKNFLNHPPPTNLPDNDILAIGHWSHWCLRLPGRLGRQPEAGERAVLFFSIESNNTTVVPCQHHVADSLSEKRMCCMQAATSKLRLQPERGPPCLHRSCSTTVACKQCADS